MARPLRIEFPGALYHVTVRGDRQERIYEDDQDRERFLEILGEVITRCNWVCHAYCLMNNHFHLVIETPDGNLAKGMRQLNGVFTQASNRKHRRTGHLFQGRYHAVLVDRDEYFLELARYTTLNPVRAGMVKHPGKWPWSSYRAMVGSAKGPPWLTTKVILEQFNKRQRLARKECQRFIAEGVGNDSIWKDLRRQIFLGNESFIEQMQAKLDIESHDVNIPRKQQLPPAPSLETIRAAHRNRDQAIVAAYETGDYSYHQIAAYFGLHFTTVGVTVRKLRKLKNERN
jgi:REP element-mobilizing transposase RayT